MFTNLIKNEQRLKEAKEIAESKGGKCLSEEYLGSKEKLEWKCDDLKHNSWFASYTNVVHNKTWCKECGLIKISDKKRNKNGLEKAKQYAISKEGQCLSSEYKNVITNLEWKCANLQHPSWKSGMWIVDRDTWCPKCAGHFDKNYFLLKAKEFAISKGGECLSNTYENFKEKLEWKCSNQNHKSWKNTYHKVVKNKVWCIECEGKILKEDKLETAKKYAKDKSGVCLSTEYKKNLEWKCSNPSHKSWRATYQKIVNERNWCYQCTGKISKEIFLLKAKEYAESKGGECLSTDYINAKEKLIWKCSNPSHHTWSAVYSITSSGSWCPKCAVYHYKEEKIRNLLEFLLEDKLPKVRPDWNINPKTKRSLELDGYSEKLKIAFEFQGQQHYTQGIFNESKESFESMKYRDEIKKQNCIKHNVKLIIIDDKFTLSRKKEIFEYVLETLKDNKICFKNDFKQEDIDNIFKKLVNKQKEYLFRAKLHAEAKGGECLSNEYLNAQENLIWKCANFEHDSWESSYTSVVNKGSSWCPQCANEKRGSTNENGLEIAKLHAGTKGGECLSNEYKSNNIKMEWKCSVPDHPIWFSNYNSVVNLNTWCPECAKKTSSNKQKNKKGLEIAKKYAQNKGGECLSNEYVNAIEKLTWKCSNQNHNPWNANYDKVVNFGRWCPQCKNERLSDINRNKNGLERAKKYAESKNGKCLSNEYVNNQGKLEWKCSNLNHPSWLASSVHIVNRERWCSHCRKENKKKI